MLSPELLAIIVCPACRNKLNYNDERQTLACTSCRRVYPIKDGIPILLVEEAKIEPA